MKGLDRFSYWEEEMPHKDKHSVQSVLGIKMKGSDIANTQCNCGGDCNSECGEGECNDGGCNI